jgi:hypothetical protein
MDPKQTLSEISHLFLSEMRERQSPGAVRPTRIPPARREDVSIDVTPQEFVAATGEGNETQLDAQNDAEATTKAAAPRMSIVLCSHLVEQPSQRAREYARHLAATAGRVGLIEADSNEVALSCFEPGSGESAPPISLDNLDERRISETLAELSFDVDHWLISLPNPRLPEARELLRAAGHWVLLTLADHDGIVATYRALKGLSELGAPRISLAVLDARDDTAAAAVFRRLEAVSEQFLHRRMEAHAPVRPAADVTEHLLLHCRGVDAARQPQWQIITDFMAGRNYAEPKHTGPSGESMQCNAPHEEAPSPIPAQVPQDAPAKAPRMAIAPVTMAEVIDLPDQLTDGSVLEAIVRQGGADGQWLACPIKPPMCPHAVVAVGRDQRLLLLAAAGPGLSELRSIGSALRWMVENRQLIRMALPQLSIDAAATPALRLVVDQADLSAELLQPLLQSGTVTVLAYRKIKWGMKIGLLLEAA